MSEQDEKTLPTCRECGRVVELARECYAIPVCYTCLPPPAPLPIAGCPACAREGLCVDHERAWLENK